MDAVGGKEYMGIDPAVTNHAPHTKMARFRRARFYRCGDGGMSRSY